MIGFRPIRNTFIVPPFNRISPVRQIGCCIFKRLVNNFSVEDCDCYRASNPRCETHNLHVLEDLSGLRKKEEGSDRIHHYDFRTHPRLERETPAVGEKILKPQRLLKYL